ncbi:hypothetical protein N5U19_11740, partial [Aliarcobacter butzleri]|uniref:hypothetical protein n=1 Tax=Aliarcobacter butzleri TaxID=28197 RepID=UPI0021B5E10B
GHRQLFKFFLKAFPKLVFPTTFGEAFFILFIDNPLLFSALLFLFNSLYVFFFLLSFISH